MPSFIPLALHPVISDRIQGHLAHLYPGPQKTPLANQGILTAEPCGALRIFPGGTCQPLPIKSELAVEIKQTFIPGWCPG